MIYILLFLSVLISGCTTIQNYQQVRDLERPEAYMRFFENLDQAVKEADARNVSAFKVSGFPYLRTNRFIAAMTDDPDGHARLELWVERMRQLDLEARRKEIRNLPVKYLNALADRLGEIPDRSALIERLDFFSKQLWEHDRRRPGFSSTLQSAIVAPSEYSTAMRVVGLYPLTSIPVAAVTRNVQKRFRQWHQAPADQIEILGKRVAYGPPSGAEYSESLVRQILLRSNSNALGIPMPSNADRQMLLEMYAPVFYQDEAAAYDRIGEIVWRNDKVSVNTARPTVYYYLSHAFLKKDPVLQLNYVIWYPARDGPLSPGIEKGPLDGLTVRVSLDHDGQPFMVDIMNNCGCYHFFLPRLEKPAEVVSNPDQLEAFVPRQLPVDYPRQRLRLWSMSGWHQINYLDAVGTAAESVPYRLVDYERLESLPHNDRLYESIFNSRGIAKDSPRIESLIFFPMGITDIGSMRQRGHHAVLFIGRAHFDDPDIFDKNFKFTY